MIGEPGSLNIPEYHVPLLNKVVRRLLRPIFRGIFHVLSPVEVTGREHIPESGAYVVVTNHISLYEPPLVLAFWPEPLEALGASEIWQRRGQSLLAKLYGGIPVRRGQVDRRLFETLIAVLKAGRPLLIMPEGGRSHAPGLQHAHAGIAYLADKIPTPIVPVGIVGTTEDYFERARRGKRPKLEMHIGKTFHLPPVEGRGGIRRHKLHDNADLVMRHIARQLPPEYRGVYAFTEEDSEHPRSSTEDD